MGFGFWILGFGFWGFGFWVLDFGFWVLGFGFWVLGFGFWILGLGFGSLGHVLLEPHPGASKVDPETSRSLRGSRASEPPSVEAPETSGGPKALEALSQAGAAAGGFWRPLEAPGGPWRPLEAAAGLIKYYQLKKMVIKLVLHFQFK